MRGLEEINKLNEIAATQGDKAVLVLVNRGVSIDVNLKAMLGNTEAHKKEVVWVATISHKYGITAYVARIQKELDEKLLEYVKEWWLEEWGPVPEIGAVDEYFQRRADQFADEFIDYYEELTL